MSPIAIHMQGDCDLDPSKALIDFGSLEEFGFNNLLPENFRELSKANDVLGGDALYIKDLKEFQNIPFTNPLCSEIMISTSQREDGTVSCAAGVTLWKVLEKLEKM